MLISLLRFASTVWDESGLELREVLDFPSFHRQLRKPGSRSNAASYKPRRHRHLHAKPPRMLPDYTRFHP
jgi:hypothetical protein